VESLAQLLWRRYRHYACATSAPEVFLDISRVRFPDELLERMSGRIAAALAAMEALERGGIANASEGRMVGHYWLRRPELAPSLHIRTSIERSIVGVLEFAAAVRAGTIRGGDGPFRNILHVGVGGSAVGPQLLCDALAVSDERVVVRFLDNADPDGVDRELVRLEGELGRTLVSVVSKSGWTPTPLHVSQELRAAYERCGLDFARHAVATTMAGSKLDRRAQAEGWLACFPLWDWVGGRTSVTSAAGLLPAALQGVDVRSFLAGAAAMDQATATRTITANPAALLALAWHWLGNGRGDRRMVVLPYRDRLALFPRHVQQLVMESLGKRCDRSGTIVHQGLTVLGHKGSSDQHSYVQQLRDGTPDSFVTFIAVLAGERRLERVELEDGVELDDYLFGSHEATRNALFECGRDSITITLRDLWPGSLGALIALYERAVGIYAELIDVNAYDQPGVDKDAAAGVVRLQRQLAGLLREAERPLTAEEIALALGRSDEVETIYKLLDRLAGDGRRLVHAERAANPFERRFAVGPGARAAVESGVAYGAEV
jgi:glucose-6-phosphate isomerase